MAIPACAPRRFAAALVLLFAAPTQAEQEAMPLVQRIDAPASRAEFSLRVAWVRTLAGRFDYLEGLVARQPQHGTFSVDVRLAALSLYMSNPEHAGWAQSEEFFDAARYPWIRFDAEGIPESVLTEGGELAGRLSLRGQTQPIAFEVEPADCDRPGLDCAVIAHGEIRRSAFGMQARRLVVSDKVRLKLGIRVRDVEPAP